LTTTLSRSSDIGIQAIYQLISAALASWWFRGGGRQIDYGLSADRSLTEFRIYASQTLGTVHDQDNCMAKNML